MTSAFAEQMEQARDLRNQISDLTTEDSQEFQMTEFSPGRRMVKLWSMVDGMEIEIPKYMVLSALTKRDTRSKTGWAFTARRTDAPAFKEGNIKCFLAEGSSERESGLLAEAGLDHLPYCAYVGGRSAFAKRRHGQGVHPQSWEILQEFISEQREEQARADQREQTDAIRALAGNSRRASKET